ncbi:MAG TPA: aminotransferase class V-fold PLP-dependent enzyme [Polyangiaceae bacterium]
MDRGRSLEPSREVQERWLAELARFALDHMAGLERAPAAGPVGQEGEEIANEVSRPIGEEPLAGALDAVIGLLDRAASASLNAPGPGYVAYIPGGGIYAAALADFVADCLNRYTGLSAPAPALFRLEQDVLAWLCAEFGYGPDGRALLTPGGSLANVSAVVAARHEHFGDAGNFERATVYTSTQAHHSVAKAVRLAGIPAVNVRLIPVDGEYRMSSSALSDAIQEDRRRGLCPFLVIAAAGTTNTGAVDPLAAIADICAKESLWFHIDGAYGAAFVLCESGRGLLSGIDRADSITFDPHKGFFLPYGTGCLLVKNGQKLRAAHHLAAEYLQDLAAAAGQLSWSPAELGPELSRDFRGLRLWLPLMLHGAGAFRDALEEKLALAHRFMAGLERLIDKGLPLEIVARPQLSLVAFRLAARTGEPLEERNRRNAAFLAAINGRQRVHMSSTLLPETGGSAFTLRVCVLSFRTHARHIDRCLEDVEAAALSVT